MGYLLTVLEMPKEADLLLDPPAPPDCDNLARYKLKEYIVNNTNSDAFKDLIHSEVFHS